MSKKMTDQARAKIEEFVEAGHVLSEEQASALLWEADRARASEAEKETKLQMTGDALERARDTLLGIVHGAPLSTVQGGLADVRTALVALGRKP